MHNKVIIAAAALLSAGTAFADADCRFSAQRSAEHSVDGIVRVEIRAGAGSLRVQGESGLRSVQATGKACARKERQLERMQIKLERNGDTLVLDATPVESSLDPRNWFGTIRLGWISRSNCRARLPSRSKTVAAMRACRTSLRQR